MTDQHREQLTVSTSATYTVTGECEIGDVDLFTLHHLHGAHWFLFHALPFDEHNPDERTNVYCLDHDTATQLRDHLNTVIAAMETPND